MDPFVSKLSKIRNRHFLVLDTLIFTLTPSVALILRTDAGQEFLRYSMSLLIVTVTCLIIKLAVFFAGGLYRRFWRYASLDEMAHIVMLGFLGLVLQTVTILVILQPQGIIAPQFPRSVPVIDGLLALMMVGGLRFSIPFLERFNSKRRQNDTAERILIVGARSVGVMIVQEMQSYPKLGMAPVAFVDDDPEKLGMSIRRVPVLGRFDDIARVAEETKATMVIIALPNERGKVIRRIVNIAEQAGLKTKIIPGMHELLDGTVGVKQLRDVEIEDLLRREPVHTDIAAVASILRGKRVLVTGGGGSIGSELCRQILRSEPASLILLGHGENSVFEAYHELSRLVKHSIPHGKAGGNSNGHSRSSETSLYAVIADIRSAYRIDTVFEKYRPEVVFHAAAHKHVPLMESNQAEAITNNVQGTRNLLEASRRFDVERFVMISTDKAVNPVSMMGASKRVAELLVHQAALKSGKPYVAVRFGNVLGSRGSVLLSFKKQIASGGPVEVTHEEMVRYFMTIPEAVELVLQAATLGNGGEVFMLDMGEPVKIMDLARDLIKLSGLREGEDIDIAITGLRPGEKLYEEMFLFGEDYERTKHEKIFNSKNAGNFVPIDLDASIKSLEAAALKEDLGAIREKLKLLVPELALGALSVPSQPVRQAVPSAVMRIRDGGRAGSIAERPGTV